MSWSKIPMTLRIAALATIALAILTLAASPFPSLSVEPRYWMSRSGFSFAARCFTIFGALELAGLVRARAAVGAKLAAVGSAAILVASLIQVFVAMTRSWEAAFWTTFQWVWWIALVAVGVGLAVTAFRRRGIAIAGGVLWLAVARPPVFDDWMWPNLLNHPHALLAVSVGQLVLQGTIVLVLAAVAVGDVPDGFAIRDVQRVRWGLTRIANALWLRVIAVSALPVVTLIIMGSQSSASFMAMGYAMVAAGLVSSVSFLGIGLGALDAARSNQTDLPRAPLYLAGACATWCAGVLLYQTPDIYSSLFQHQSGYLAERTADAASAFTIVLPLVGYAAIVFWTVSVGTFAALRNRLDLSERAHRTGVWFVVLSAASLGVTVGLVPEARSAGSMMLTLLLALVLGLVAIINAARLARDSAELGIADQATIPTATLV